MPCIYRVNHFHTTKIHLCQGIGIPDLHVITSILRKLALKRIRHLAQIVIHHRCQPN
jgi:hypothetical protein